MSRVARCSHIRPPLYQDGAVIPGSNIDRHDPPSSMDKHNVWLKQTDACHKISKRRENVRKALLLSFALGSYYLGLRI